MLNKYLDTLLQYPFYDIKFLRYFFKINSINFKKGFGQNFIIDRNILRKYNDIFLEYFNKNDIVYEIGGGCGNLSLLLINRVKKLYIFEIDNFFAKFLQQIFEKKKYRLFVCFFENR